MDFNKYMIRISIRLVLIFLAMLTLALVTGQQARLFTVVGVALILLFLVAELYRTIARTNQIVESLLDSIRFGDFNKTIGYKPVYRLADRSSGIPKLFVN